MPTTAFRSLAISADGFGYGVGGGARSAPRRVQRLSGQPAPWRLTRAAGGANEEAAFTAAAAAHSGALALMALADENLDAQVNPGADRPGVYLIRC